MTPGFFSASIFPGGLHLSLDTPNLSRILKMNRQKKAYLYAVTALIFWSTVASAFKITLRHLGFIEMLLYASSVSTATLAAILVAQGKAEQLKACTMREILQSAFLGLLNPFLYYLILFKSYELLPAQEAQPLNYTWPIMLTLLSAVMLRQRISAASLMAIGVSFSGVLVISTHGDISGLKFTNPAGALLALSSSLIWALFWILNVKDRRDEIVKLFLSFFFGSVYTLIAVTVLIGEFACPPAAGLIGAAYIGLFEMGITFLVWLKALSASKTTAQVSNLIYLSPFLSLFLISAAVGEKIMVSTIVGLMLIVSGIIIQQYAGINTADRPGGTS